MKKLILLLLFVPFISIGQVQETFFEDSYLTFKTQKVQLLMLTLHTKLITLISQEKNLMTKQF